MKKSNVSQRSWTSDSDKKARKVKMLTLNIDLLDGVVVLLVSHCCV